MGWSCRADAGATLDKFGNACIAQTGSSNVFEAGGKRYFYEVSNTEHGDGAITGSIWKFLTHNPDGSGKCVKAGSFRINPNGSIARAPAFLKKAAKDGTSARPASGAVGFGSGGY